MLLLHRCIENVIVKSKPACPLCRQPIDIPLLIDPPPTKETDPLEPNSAAATATGEGPASAVGCSSGGDAVAAAAKQSAKVQALISRLQLVEQEVSYCHV